MTATTIQYRTAVEDMLAAEGFTQTGIPASAFSTRWSHVDDDGLVVRVDTEPWGLEVRISQAGEDRKAEMALSGPVTLEQARGAVRLFTGWTG